MYKQDLNKTVKVDFREHFQVNNGVANTTATLNGNLADPFKPFINDVSNMVIGTITNFQMHADESA